MGAAIGEVGIVGQSAEFDIAAVTVLRVLAPAGPDALIGIGGADITAMRVGVGDEIDALDALQGYAPVGAVIADEGFEFLERQVDLVKAGKAAA